VQSWATIDHFGQVFWQIRISYNARQGLFGRQAAAATMPPCANLLIAQTLSRRANLQATAMYVQVAGGKRGEAIDRLKLSE
jgi:hypothetical protein